MEREELEEKVGILISSSDRREKSQIAPIVNGTKIMVFVYFLQF